MAFLRLLRLALVLLAIEAIAWALLALAWPGDLPWAPFRLDRPLGPATGLRIAALAGDGPRCRALLDEAGIAYRPLPARAAPPECAYADAVAWTRGGTRRAAYAPAAPPLACPLAAALAVWEQRIVQPAAERRLGGRVARIDHYGSYACRRLYGRAAGGWSEHATAGAIDIAGFVLADGRRITVARDWRGTGAEARFLHAIRDGGCRLFATTLSPDYNAAHRDHLHLDMARRGGWRACR